MRPYRCDVIRPSKISIHAPRVGCDTDTALTRCSLRYFNPRTPCGVRPISSSVAACKPAFQSTHPVWGATTSHCLSLFRFLISIHAPRVGCDASIRGSLSKSRISIHAPRVGCDLGDAPPTDAQIISIHAPRVGCDTNPRRTGTRARNFNPRTPRGVRQTTNTPPRTFWIFQSTHPAWDATDGILLRDVSVKFQSTHPAWGATGSFIKNPLNATISIHAPRVGCDACSCALIVRS